MYAPNVFYTIVSSHEFLFAHSRKTGSKRLDQFFVGVSRDVNPSAGVGSLKFVNHNFSFLELGTSFGHLRMTAGWQYLMVLLDALILQIWIKKSEKSNGFF